MRNFLLMFSAIVLLSGQAKADTMSVTFSGAEVRSQPSVANSKTLFKAPRYYPLQIIESGTEYYKVKDYRGRSGWLHKSLLNDTPSLVVTAQKANVRAGAGTDNPVVFQASRGDSFMLLNSIDSWLQIQRADGATGWIFGDLVWAE